MKKVLIFDFDGVILDSIAIVEQDLRERYPKLTPAMNKKIVEGNFHEELAKFKRAHGYPDLIGEAAEQQRVAYAKKKLAAELYPGIGELLEALERNGYVLVLNTSAWERNVLPILEKHNLTRFFDFIATAEISKDKINKFKLIKQRYGAGDRQIIFITDTLGDLREAEAAGVPTICVTWGSHTRDYFLREKHTNLIAIVEDSGKLLKTIMATQ